MEGVRISNHRPPERENRTAPLSRRKAAAALSRRISLRPTR
jgi:hypothetical protein